MKKNIQEALLRHAHYSFVCDKWGPMAYSGLTPKEKKAIDKATFAEIITMIATPEDRERAAKRKAEVRKTPGYLAQMKAAVRAVHADAAHGRQDVNGYKTYWVTTADGPSRGRVLGSGETVRAAWQAAIDNIERKGGK